MLICMVYGILPVKVTVELPSPLVQRLRTCVPSGHRSGFVAALISKRLRGKGGALEQAARKANGLRRVNRDMKDWEALNERAMGRPFPAPGATFKTLRS